VKWLDLVVMMFSANLVEIGLPGKGTFLVRVELKTTTNTSINSEAHFQTMGIKVRSTDRTGPSSI